MTLRTSETVAAGHPDKLCDQVSDAVLDAYLQEDPNARVAVETMATAAGLVLAGEVASLATPDRTEIARTVIRDIGYEKYSTLPIVDRVVSQSPQIGAAVADGGAGDQGVMFGYATNETQEMLPATLVLARKLRDAVADLGWHPDFKTQVTAEYGEDGKPHSLSRVVISACHPDTLQLAEVRETLAVTATRVLIEHGWDHASTELQVQPSGAWTHGGPAADTGLTGRKLVVDTYGGGIPHGGGAFSGKDPSKVDRSGAYAARWVAKTIVAAGLADHALVEVAYAIGWPEPLAVRVDTGGTGVVSDGRIEEAVNTIFDLSPAGIIRELNLRRVPYRNLAANGHFGGDGLPWEDTSHAPALRAAVLAG